MGLKEFYHAIEDKYYAGLDWLDAHGIPVYRVVDAIEAQNIPSFPVAMLVLVLLLGGIWFALSGNLGAGNSLTVTVIDGTQTPISGARVELSGDNFLGQSLLTDARGKVTFSGIPAGTLLTLNATKDDYQFRSTSVTLDAGENVARLTGIATPRNKSVALQLYQSGTTQAFSDVVELQFTCPEDSTFSETRVVSNGRITLEDVPSECDTLNVTSSDVRVQLQNGVIDTTAAQPLLYLSLAQQGNAELQVTIVGSDALPIEGIEVVLNSAYGDPLQTKFSDNAGNVKFTGIVADTYTVSAHDGAGRYASKTSPATPISGTNNAISLVLEQAAVGEVRLQVVDESNLAPIANATVIISRGTQTLPAKRTDETGKVSIPVSSGAGLSASIDHPNYLIAVVPVTVSTAGFSTISLTRATAENSQVLTVQIKDELNNPVEGAQVALKKAVTGASVGATKTTGASGTVVFTSLEEGGYFVSAYKPGFSDQKRSDVVQVRARTNATLGLQLTLGTGTIEVMVNDDAGAAISGATIQVLDAITHNPAANEVISDVEGKASITLRADKIVYFVVSEGTYSTVTTIPYAVKKSVSQNVRVELPKSVSRIEAKILQLWFKGQPLESESALVPGQTYTAVLGLYLPDGAEPTEAGIHVRTGNSDEGKTNPIENDDWYIRDVRAASATIKRGTTYTPPLGLGIDNQNLTTGNSKWATVAIQNPHEGLTLIEVDLQVKDSAIQGVDLPLYYRAYSKSGSFTRFPLDAVLGGSDSTGDKQGLYANANLSTYSVGNTSSTCTKDMCVALVLEDLQTRLQSPVFKEAEVDVATQHRLGFVFRSLSDSVLQDTKILVKSSTASADLKTYEVVNAVGVKKTGTAQGNVVDVALGTVQRDNVITGFVNFTANKEGSSNVTLSIISGKNEVFKRELRVKVNAASVFEVEVLPQALLPLLTNQILAKAFVQAEGGRIGLENVSVTIKKNGTTLTSGFTDGEGIFPYELNEPNVGDTIELTLEKAGYRPIIKTIRVGDNIVLFSPNQINENLIINGVSRKTREVRLTNLSSIPLKLAEVKLSGGFEELIKFELLSDTLIGSEIPVNGDVNLAFAISLTEKGMKLLNAQTFNAAIVVTTETTTSGKAFVNALPAIIKAGFGGEVDDSSCLIVEPLKWDIYTNANEQKQLGFEIKNNCKVKGESVRLTNLSAKIKQISGDALGTFTATALDGKKVELGAGFRTVLESLPANGSATVNVQFAPGSILSGVATPELAFQAINLTQGGNEDSIGDTVKINLVVNDLTKCLEVKTPQALTIESCPINLGFGQYGNYFNQGLYQPTGVPYYNPSFSVLNQTTNPSGTSLLPSNQSTPYNAGSSIYNPYYTRNTLNSGYYGTTGYNGLGQYNPNGQPFNPATGNYAQLNGYYANPLVDSYNTQPGGYSNYISGCGSTEVRIENSCQSEVDVQLDADPNLQTSANTFTLKPNQTQRVRIASGVRIGRYPFIVSAKARGSVDATTEVANLAVLIKSPTEVNGDCISLDRTKYSFNEFVQTPVKGKVYNNCYDQGVRLVERGDTVTLSSFFNPDATQEVVLDPRTVPGAVPRNNTLVNSIQTTGLSTKSNGDGGTIQVYEFQIFPDFQTYRRQIAPGQQGGIGEKILDIKTFAEKNYYRVESYGVISVKYLDAFSAAQQKQFPVIFENLFKLASALDALIGGGSPAITNFQDCINVNALQNRAVTSDNKEVAPLTFGDSDFKQFTTFTYLTQFPDSVIKVADTHCGGQDYLSKLSPAKLESKDDSRVFATFQVVDKRDIQVTINRPLTLAKDVVIEGRLEAELTRTFVNAGTQRVSIPVKITVQRLKNPQNNNALQLQACTAEGYVSGNNFSTRYGFDKLSWDWTFNGSPDCSNTFCDATQLFLYLAKDKVKKFNQFLANNPNAFTSSERTGDKSYSTRTLILDIHESVQDIKDITTPSSTPKAFFIGQNNKLLPIAPTASAKPVFQSQFQNVKDSATTLLAKEKGVSDQLSFVKTMQSALNTLQNQREADQWVVVLDEEALRTKSGDCRTKNDPNCDSTLQNVLALLGAEERKDRNGKKHLYWSFREFQALHDQLVQRVEANNGTKLERFDDASVLSYVAT
ncbi:MAG: carboxypeptidase regulatory-like domain-containing protein [Candidatus Iainarchaeum archaeon]|uniref:Carboxypeptidase regulatory-like domain-containing protein n=1 Tax=Candidatus Iainarchaeum sp. TaxID=3101447 RepID=A0A7T9DKQ5_9ARCH|nr:MAG: carboxypeptidase regulatory-like domain-containing protein [Candidatus Diapherotrites archaeon]